MPILVIFDGICNLCNGAVQWIIRRDPTMNIRFVALQSPKAQQILRNHGINGHTIESIIVIDTERVYSESDAALRICRYLRWPWPIIYHLRIIPRPWRDAIYRWIARNRYRWFGKRVQCMIPTPTQQNRFLGDD